MKLIQTMLVPAILCITLLAQEAPTTTVGTGGGQARAAKVRSPEVLADGRVTFRLLAPKATEVLVQGNWEGGRGLAMTKDNSGLWSVTTPALQPEVWAYTFSVDGIRTLDPGNYNVARDGVGFMNTLLVLSEASAVFEPLKNTKLTETIGLQFRAEAFNLFNRVQFTPPNTQFGSSTFGQVTAQYNQPRLFQFGLRLSF